MRSGRLRVLVLAGMVCAGGAGFLSAGCATGAAANDHVAPEVPMWFARPSGALKLSFRRALTAYSRKGGEDYERGKPCLDPAHDRVFVGSSDHGLYALRASGGSTLWRFETLGMVQSEPYYDAELDMVYFGSNDGALYAVKAENGQRVFRFDSAAEVSRRPVRVGANILFASAADFLFAVDAKTGKEKWQVHRTSALGMEIAGHAGPAYDDKTGLVTMAYSDGHVVAYDGVTGSEKWPVDLAAEAEQKLGQLPRYLDVDTTPVPGGTASNRVVFVASYAGGVYALDAKSGARVWSNEQALGVTDLVFFEEEAKVSADRAVDPLKIVIASSAQTGLWGLEADTGKVAWRNAVPEGGVTAPTRYAGAILVGTSRYGLFLISPRNGRVIDGIDTGNGILATPAAAGTRAFVMTNGGNLLGLQVDGPGSQPRARSQVSSFGF